MIRTQIQLQNRLYAELRETAIRQHRSMAACIRDAVVSFLRQSATDVNDLSDIAGKFQPMPTDEMKDHDRVWAEAVVRERPAP
jgi:hypothetical protein